MITTTTAASILGVTPAEVRRLCRLGLIPAQRVGRDWLLQETDVRAYHARPKGRPKSRDSQ
jgi:excisionase family DNA binding protein